MRLSLISADDDIHSTRDIYEIMKPLFAHLGLATGAYCAVALIVFGDLFKPIAFATVFQNRLGAPFWQALVAISATTAIVLASAIYGRFRLNARYLTPAFISLWMCISVLLVGIYAECLRYRKLKAFNPDEYSWRSFIVSIRKAPRDFQFFLHAAALKDCKPYAWSYRQMDFYELSPNVAVNVLPDDWIKRCAIKRTR